MILNKLCCTHKIIFMKVAECFEMFKFGVWACSVILLCPTDLFLCTVERDHTSQLISFSSVWD